VIAEDRRLGLLPLTLFTAGILVYLVVSPPLLTALNIPYDAPKGNFVFKLHPGTYLVCLAFAAAHAGRGNVLRSFWRSIAGAEAVALYGATILCIFLYELVRFGTSGPAFLIDTLLMPAVCALFLQLVDRRLLRFFLLLVVAIVAMNAVLGIGESILHRRIVPYTVAGGVVLKEDAFRSTALMGHPLVNALVTGTTLFFCFALPAHAAVRTLLMSVLLLGLLAFGGRTSLAISAVVLVAYLLHAGVRRLLAGQISYTQITGGLVAVFLGLGAFAAVVLLTGVGERIFSHMKWDRSADVRLHVWLALRYMSASDILFGVSVKQIELITYRLGLEYPLTTIENFWLLMLMNMGAIGLAFFVLSLVIVFGRHWSANVPGVRAALVVFLVAASSNNSLCSKTSSLVIFFVLLECARAYAPLSRSRPLGWPARPFVGAHA
jgi:hypothetical protein